MKKHFIFFLFAIQSLNAQKIEPTKLGSKSALYDVFIGTDEYDVPYFIKNNVFTKATATQIFEYKNLTLGKISKIDLQNPLKILVFYQDFNSVVTLDNQLNETNIVNLSENKIQILASAATMSAQNKFWIYNTLSQKVGLFDFLNDNYSEITPPMMGDISVYESDFNFFRWISYQQQLVSCDVFGKMTFHTMNESFDKIQILDSDKVIVHQNNKLLWMNLATGVKKEINIVEKTIDNFCYKNQILTIFTKQKLNSYKIILE